MPPQILLVDDDPNILASLKRALRNEGYGILLASSGEDALKALEAIDIDIVISDHDMEGMNGAELLQQVYEKYPQTVRYMLTGKATLEVALSAINLGHISRFFQKPCDITDLCVSIRQGLVQRRLMRKVKELMSVNATQREHIARLEEQYPGISRVDRSQTGAILLRPVDADYAEFLRKINEIIP